MPNTSLFATIENIKKMFPSFLYGFAYGSGAFNQSNYDYAKHKPLIDFIFVVENAAQFHAENFIMNRFHYGGLSSLVGYKFPSLLHQSVFPILFFPYIKINEYESIKYGVIDKKSFVSDLQNWDILSCAGRLHKPVLYFDNSAIFPKDIYKTNLLFASSIALLMMIDNNAKTYDEIEFFKTISSLSYIGDIRVSLNFENKNKVDNIVKGNLKMFQELYHDILIKEYHSDNIEWANGEISIKYNQEFQELLIQNFIPSQLKFALKDNCNDLISLTKLKRKQILTDFIQNINYKASRNMLIAQGLSNSPIKAIAYVYQKLLKAIFQAFLQIQPRPIKMH